MLNEMEQNKLAPIQAKRTFVSKKDSTFYDSQIGSFRSPYKENDDKSSAGFSIGGRRGKPKELVLYENQYHSQKPSL